MKVHNRNVLLVILFIICVAPISVFADKLSMQIFYGSLCGDSINFIQNQVHPIHNDIKDYVNITFVPFGIGKSTTDENGTVSFSCNYDIEGCKISRIQLCAIDYLKKDRQAIMNFVACQMAFQSDRSGQKCAEQSEIPFDVLSKCINSRAGIELQLEAEKSTNNFRNPLTWLPTIGYNWEYVEDLSHRSETNLRDTVCELLDNNAPFCNKFFYGTIDV